MRSTGRSKNVFARARYWQRCMYAGRWSWPFKCLCRPRKHASWHVVKATGAPQRGSSPCQAARSGFCFVSFAGSILRLAATLKSQDLTAQGLCTKFKQGLCRPADTDACLLQLPGLQGLPGSSEARFAPQRPEDAALAAVNSKLHLSRATRAAEAQRRHGCSSLQRRSLPLCLASPLPAVRPRPNS